jgi:hypothetical protein
MINGIKITHRVLEECNFCIWSYENLSLQFPIVVECYTRGTVYSDKMLSFKISSEFI